MRKQTFVLACVLGLTVAAAAATVRAEDGDYAELGLYLGAGGVYAIEMFDVGGVDNSNGFNVRGGYRVHPNVAVEGLFEYYSKFDMSPGDLSAWSLTANAKVYPLLGRWQPYALVGLGYLSGDADFGQGNGSGNEDGFVMRFGGGLDANITENWQIGPEVAYVLPFGDIEDFDAVTISGGIRYMFR